jgi:uncharacterized membrane protein
VIHEDRRRFSEDVPTFGIMYLAKHYYFASHILADLIHKIGIPYPVLISCVYSKPLYNFVNYNLTLPNT